MNKSNDKFRKFGLALDSANRITVRISVISPLLFCGNDFRLDLPSFSQGSVLSSLSKSTAEQENTISSSSLTFIKVHVVFRNI